MAIKTFNIKPQIYLGKGSLEWLKQVQGKRAFIVSDAIIENLGYLKLAEDYLQQSNIETAVFTEVYPDPDVKILANGMDRLLKQQADILVALGGGSVIDTAKGILYAARQFIEAKGEVYEKPLFIAIPSTSGTGSEVTDFSVITVDQEKICIVDEYIAPDIAILDSTCIKHVPSKVAVDTGIDVLVHAIEAYLSVKATDYTDALAEKAVQLIFGHLETLYHDPAADFARDRVQNASCLAGMAFTNAGLGLTHSLAHAFGAKFHISHGRSNALFMTVVMEYNANLSGKMDERVCAKLAHLADLLHLPARTVREGCVSFIEAVRGLKKRVAIDGKITSLGIEKEFYEQAIEQMASTALQDRCTPTNPKQPSKENMIVLYQQAFL